MYVQPSKENWSGRIDSHNDPLSFRFHQNVLIADLSNVQINSNKSQTFGILGYQCDAGVKRNQGRPGAAEAPDKIKQTLAKLSWHLPTNTDVFDMGNIKCEGDQLEEAQTKLGEAITFLFNKGVTPIILGGGHETFYGHYLGVREFIGPDAKLGIINIDAHFDMRPYDEKTSSGTMFKQILDQDLHCHYLCAGIQRQGNTMSLFETAKQYQVKYILEEDLSRLEINHALNEIDHFIEQHDYIILTLCTDVINSAYAPGVSAPSPFGLDPKAVRTLIRHIVAKEKLLSFDISEVNPAVDENNKTVVLAAQLINEVLMNFHSYKNGGLK
ncbi:formimidoylglutamase [Heyndrickxia sp. NPDC080065]|uniref:formimidoylglutamase n=1 Tax=Heyndrickxia sp. NPDC080065 TaxID=3390568 RepID=UPI003D04F9F4